MYQRRPCENTSVLVVFGTRPELIKLTPVVHELARHDGLRVVTVTSSQQADLLPVFLDSFAVSVDYDLDVMVPGQPVNLLLSRLVAALDPVIESVRPALVVVQGDTTTALGGALAARMRGVPVAHVEAGLRSGDPRNPFPEELNRRLITQVTSLHLAPTERNVESLLHEGVTGETIALTGNPIVDSLHEVLAAANCDFDRLDALLEPISGKRTILLTTHRRESFGPVMEGHLRVLRAFIERHPDLALAFPVHPNPAVREAAQSILEDVPRVLLLPPLDYPDFIELMRRAWFVVSDSGGVQEEAPTLGKAVLILRRTTERPEALEAGFARLIDGGPDHLARELAAIASDDGWIRSLDAVDNPFGRGDSGKRIAEAVTAFLGVFGTVASRVAS